MAVTWSQIKSVRLAIDDPSGMVNLETVANTAALPAVPAKQTAYRVESTGGYYDCSLDSGATADDYEYVDILLSDAQIESIIELVGITEAPCRALRRIARRLGSQLGIVRNSTGAESTEYTSLLNMYQYYKALSEDCEEENSIDSGDNTGKWGQSSQPEIAGDNL